MKLAGKTVVITGAAGGIGKAASALFLAQGASVLMVDRDEKDLAAAAAELGSDQVHYVAADVTETAQVEAYAQKAKSLFGQVDIFFSNAGVEGVVKPIEEYPEEIFDQVMAVNVKGVWLGNKYMSPLMREGGSIIITSSVAGLGGTPNVSAYVASKHAANGIMRSLCYEMAPRKIRVNTINPSPVDNRMMRSLEEGFAPGAGEAAKQNFEQSIPLQRYATNEEVAQLALWLASDDSRFITGTFQVIDGGMLA